MDEQVGSGDRQRLMIRGVLSVGGSRETCTLVERGMPILSREGRQLGKVAAVSVDESGTVDAILLSRLPLKKAYRIVPADLVVAVDAGTVALRIGADGINLLQKRYPDDLSP